MTFWQRKLRDTLSVTSTKTKWKKIWNKSIGSWHHHSLAFALRGRKWGKNKPFSRVSKRLKLFGGSSLKQRCRQLLIELIMIWDKQVAWKERIKVSMFIDSKKISDHKERYLQPRHCKDLQAFRTKELRTNIGHALHRRWIWKWLDEYYRIKWSKAHQK